MIRPLTIATAATLATAGIASAAVDETVASVSPLNLTVSAQIDRGIVPRTTPVEDFEAGFPAGGVGAVADVNGWSLGSAWGIETPGLGGSDFAIQLANPNPLSAGSTVISPAGATGFGISTFDVRIDDLPTSPDTFGIEFGNNVTTTIATRFVFQSDNTIDVLQVVGGGGAFVEEIITFADGEEFQLGTEVLADGTLNVYKDGSLVFSGEEINFALSGVAQSADSVVGALFLTGTGADIVGGFDGTFDNFGNTLVPEPTSAALLALGGLTALRRRRA
ncbi:MAG: PEP-CTERM sorting domain-containing protein [Planctomycetota bacterium]